MITGASLDHPNRQVRGCGFRNGMIGAVPLGPVCLAALMLTGLFLGLGWEYMGPTADWMAFAGRG